MVPHKRNSKVWPGLVTKEKTMKYPTSAICTVCVSLYGYRVWGTCNNRTMVPHKEIQWNNGTPQEKFYSLATFGHKREDNRVPHKCRVCVCGGGGFICYVDLITKIVPSWGGVPGFILCTKPMRKRKTCPNNGRTMIEGVYTCVDVSKVQTELLYVNTHPHIVGASHIEDVLDLKYSEQWSLRSYL